VILDTIKDWRLDRYYTSKAQLLDLTLQVAEAKHCALQAFAVVVAQKSSVVQRVENLFIVLAFS
jgi:hypothetical protein